MNIGDVDRGGHIETQTTVTKIGVMMHVTDSTVTPAVLAVEAEQRGFESVFVTEHTHIPVRPFIAWRRGEAIPELSKHLYDPIVALAAAALG